MKLPFQPIARRDFKFTSEKTTLHITLAVSAPYKLSKPSQFGQYGCLIIDNDDPEFTRELVGDNEFEVLEMALIHFRNYLRTLIESAAGTLLNGDGTPFVLSSTIVQYASHLESSSPMVLQAIHDRMGKPK